MDSKTYTYDEVLKSSIEYFRGDELAATTWMNKYALVAGESDGKPTYYEKDPSDMHKRLAKEFRRIEMNYANPMPEKLIFDLLDKFNYIIPAGGPMSGIGNNSSLQSLSNCFVVGNKRGNQDSYGGILKIDQEAIQLCKRRGGVGTDLSGLRPAMTPVTNAAKSSSGVVSFMERYSNSIKEVSQKGRRGALMLTISIKHPDSEAFIDAKVDTTKITGANISVKLDEDFMKAVEEDKYYCQVYPIYEKVEDVLGPFTNDFDPDIVDKLMPGNKKGTWYKIIKARKIWDKLIYNNWKSAEPGVLFWDKVLSESPADQYEGYETTCTNPCLKGDTLVLTERKPLTIKEITDLFNQGEKIKVWTYNEQTDNMELESVTNAMLTKKNAETIEVVTSKGSVTCTPDHKFFVRYAGDRKMMREWVEAKDLDSDKHELIANYPGTMDCIYLNIESVEITNQQYDVYDLTTEDNHNFFANNILVHNCGELPLTPYDSCRLMAMNLYSYVDNPFTPIAKFNFNLFEKHVIYAQRLMDDLVDLEIEKVDAIIKKIINDPEDDETKFVELNLWKKIREKATDGRRTGLGITAEGDMLAALGLQYASEEAINFSEKVHKLLAVTSYATSIQLADERGKFKGCDYKTDMKSGFCERISSEMIKQDIIDWKKYGRRNIGNLTIAPTGTVSIMTQTTSGIEPVFMVSYKRRRKTSDKSKAVFIDPVGEMFEEYRVIHPKFIEWYSISKSLPYDVANKELNEMDDATFQLYFESSPYFKSTAQDIDWVNKVRMQGTIQKWVDHSISCTVNMPESTTVYTVNDVYLAAWESGCKGITIYRDGCRSGVLVADKSKETPTEKPKVISRPDSLESRVLRFRNGNEYWIAFVGVYEGRPFEIFTGKIDDDIRHLPKSIESGIINKVEYINKDGEKAHRYDFQYDAGFGYTNTLPDIGNAFNPETYNYARMVSAMLQEEMNLDKIVNVLIKLKCGDTINAWNRGVARALKKFIEDGTKSAEKCEICGGDMVYESGCKHCTSCGASKCE